MPEQEHDIEGVPLSAIRVNLEDRTVELEDQQGTVAKLVFPPFGTIYFQGSVSSLPEAPTPSTKEPERTPTVTLTGRLTAKPRQGKADRSGNLTAYARFAAHVEGEQGPHDYIATFHRHTARLALGFDRDAQITVEGYPHPSGSESRLDTFSVVNILNLQAKRQRSS